MLVVQTVTTSAFFQSPRTTRLIVIRFWFIFVVFVEEPTRRWQATTVSGEPGYGCVLRDSVVWRDEHNLIDFLKNDVSINFFVDFSIDFSINFKSFHYKLCTTRIRPDPTTPSPRYI